MGGVCKSEGVMCPHAITRTPPPGISLKLIQSYNSIKTFENNNKKTVLYRKKKNTE